MPITTKELDYVAPGLDGVLRMEKGTTNVPAASSWPVVGMCVLWAGTADDVPRGWAIVREFDDVYLKGATADDEVLTTGGAAGHVHTSPAHAHTTPNHNHSFADTSTSISHTSFSVQVDGTSIRAFDGGDASHDHDVSGTTGDAAPTTNTTAATVDETEVTPPFLKLYLIRYTGEA